MLKKDLGKHYFRKNHLRTRTQFCAESGFVLHFFVQENVADYIFPQLFVQKHILFYCTLI